MTRKVKENIDNWQNLKTSDNTLRKMDETATKTEVNLALSPCCPHWDFKRDGGGAGVKYGFVLSPDYKLVNCGIHLV